MRLLYEERDNLLYKSHPFTITFFIVVIFVLSLLFTHPLYLTGLLLVVGSSIVTTGNAEQWKGYLKFSIPMMVMIILINMLFVREGASVLYSGPRVPFIGKIRITSEAMAYGVGMSIRLLVIISLFCLFTYIIQPDKFMKMFSSAGNKSVFVVILAIRLFPLMVSDYRRIMEVQRCRGVRIDSGTWIDKIKNMLPVVSVLLLSCLERSFQQAESMHARGYGSGKRTVFHKELWRWRDYLIITATLIGLISGIWAYIAGFSSYIYYPKMEAIDLMEMRNSIVVTAALLFPIILNWGWKKWAILRLKI